jgi:hypothetical protein
MLLTMILVIPIWCLLKRWRCSEASRPATTS